MSGAPEELGHGSDDSVTDEELHFMIGHENLVDGIAQALAPTLDGDLRRIMEGEQ